MTTASYSGSPTQRLGNVVTVSLRKLPGARISSASRRSGLPTPESSLDELTFEKLVAYSKGHLSALGTPVPSSVIVDAVMLMARLRSLSSSRPQVAADGEGGLDVEARLDEERHLSLHVTSEGIEGVVQRRGTLEATPIEAADVESAIERVRIVLS